MTLAVLAKAILIALIAAFAAWLYLLAFSQYAGGEIAAQENIDVMLYGSLLGSFVIGLPIALLVFWMSHKHLIGSPSTLAMIATLAGIMQVLASFVIGDTDGVLMLGIPAFIAALTYGILGWFWILKPMREDTYP